MKQALTVRSILFNSLIVIIFAACGANAQKKAEICPHQGLRDACTWKEIRRKQN